MKKLLASAALTALLLTSPAIAATPSLSQQLAGKILLAVEDKGKTYYVNADGKRYRVTRVTAFEIFKKLSLGISNKDLAQIPEGTLGVDPETGATVGVASTGSTGSTLAKQLSGKILLAVEDKGKTYYVHSDGRRYRVTQNTAFEIFKKLALGISNKDLTSISEASLEIDPETGVASTNSSQSTPIANVNSSTNVNSSVEVYVPDEPEPSVSCCKVCSKGKACGNSCISRSYTCHQPPGCACDGY